MLYLLYYMFRYSYIIMHNIMIALCVVYILKSEVIFSSLILFIIITNSDALLSSYYAWYHGTTYRTNDKK
jgi:hypothetical protein